MSRDVIERKEFQYAPTAAGTIALFEIPAGWALVGLYARVDVPRVAGTGVTVGEGGGDVDGFWTEAQLDSDGAAGLRDPALGDFSIKNFGGKFYATEDTIDGILTGTPSTMPVIKFVAFIRRVIGV
jgi:hypothetical protein